jgi:ribonuclease P protein component
MERRLRLRRSEDYARLRREGRRYQHHALALSMVENNLSHNRYGFVTSKRVGKAVARNRVRRLLREVLRSLHPHLRDGFDVVVVARPAIVGQRYADVQRIVEGLAQQAGLM